MAVFSFYRPPFSEVVCAYKFEYGAVRPSGLLLASPLQHSLHLHLQEVCAFVWAHVRRHCSQGLHFKQIKNTPDSPARIINHRTQGACERVLVCVIKTELKTGLEVEGRKAESREGN